MKKLFLVAAIFLAGFGFSRWQGTTYAQTAAAVLYAYEMVPSGGTVANCPAVVTGVTAWCKVASGQFQSINGSAWVALSAAAPITAAPVLSVNGKIPDSKGNVALAASTSATTSLQ